MPSDTVSAAMPDRRDRDAGIDMLRGAAALAVVAFHLWLYATPAPPSRARSAADTVWSSGRLGLVLFFVLSDYLLYRPWVRAAQCGERGPDPFAFLRRRAVRVLPAYYLALAGAVVLLAGAGSTPGVRLPPVEKLPLFMILAQNFDSSTIMKLDPPMWTLVVEVCFYLMLPILGAIAVKLRRPGLVAAGTLAAGLVYDIVLAGHGFSQPWTKALPALLPLFAVGMLAAQVPVRTSMARSSRAMLCLAAVALVVGNVVFHSISGGSVALVVRDLPAAVGFALALVATRDVQPRRWAARALAGVGTISFGLYLWHLPILWWLRSTDLLPLDPVAAAPVVLGPSLALASLSWRYLERPILTRAAVSGRSRPSPVPAR